MLYVASFIQGALDAVPAVGPAIGGAAGQIMSDLLTTGDVKWGRVGVKAVTGIIIGAFASWAKGETPFETSDKWYDVAASAAQTFTGTIIDETFDVVRN